MTAKSLSKPKEFTATVSWSDAPTASPIANFLSLHRMWQDAADFKRRQEESKAEFERRVNRGIDDIACANGIPRELVIEYLGLQ